MKRYPDKKLYAALITALCITPFAVQADKTHEVYGQARASVDFTDDGVKNVTNVSSTNSRLGFKGVEDLGNGLKALFQFETRVGLDGSSTTLFDGLRNSYVGLAGGFGTVVLGIMDTPYRLAAGRFDNWGDSMGDSRAIIGTASTRAGTLFNQRERNTINYWSPKMSGFQLLAAYLPDEDGAVKQDRYSVAGVYRDGPYDAALAYEFRENAANSAGGTSGTRIYDIDAWVLGLGYTFNHDNTKINFVYEDLSQDRVATLLDRNMWYLALSHKIGSNTFRIAYAQADDNDTGANTGADWYAAGLAHRLSGRTELYALYARTDNDSLARYGLGTSGTSGAVGSPALGGRDLSTFSIGVNHRF